MWLEAVKQGRKHKKAAGENRCGVPHGGAFYLSGKRERVKYIAGKIGKRELRTNHENQTWRLQSGVINSKRNRPPGCGMKEKTGCFRFLWSNGGLPPGDLSSDRSCGWKGKGCVASAARNWKRTHLPVFPGVSLLRKGVCNGRSGKLESPEEGFGSGRWRRRKPGFGVRGYRSVFPNSWERKRRVSSLKSDEGGGKYLCGLVHEAGDTRKATGNQSLVLKVF